MRLKLLVVFVSAICFASLLSGQQEHTRKLDRASHGDQKFIKLAEKLELSPDQKKALFELFKDKKGDRKSKKKKRPSDKDRAVMRHDLNEEVANILNEKQLEQYLELQKERDAKKELKKESMAQLVVEIKSYRDKNVSPILNGQRKKLDASLTIDEKTYISEIQSRKKQNKKAKRTRRMRYQLSDIEKTELKSITLKYKDEIDDLLSEISSQKEIWDSDIMEIKKSYKETFQRGNNHLGENRKTKQKKKYKKKRNSRGQDFGERGHIGFLLRDTEH